MMPPAPARNQRRGALLLLAVVGLLAPPATAATIPTGSDVQLRWDTTIWLRTLLQPARASLNLNGYCTGSTTPGCAYGGGARSARVDATTAVDLNADRFGLHVGAITWYDAVDRPSYTQYPTGRVVEFDPSAHGGQKIELFEAYGRAAFDIGNDRLLLNAGRHTLTWGETLFFSQNGIASGQAPIDTYRPQANGTYGGSESFLPVNQLSLTWLRAGGWSVSAYWQLEWRRSRIDPHDAYASASDTLGAEGNRVLTLGPNEATALSYDRASDRRPRGMSQYGLALRGQIDTYDVGFYALRFAAKTPVVLLQPWTRGGAGSYRLDYPSDIELYGLSIAGPLGPAGFGFELSGRRNMPLVNGGIPIRGGPSLATIDPRRVEPLGDSLHTQFSWMQKLEPSLLFASGADLNAEIAANYLLSARNDAPTRNLGRTRFALALRTELVPHLFQIAPHLDLSLPVGVGLNLLGLSSIDPAMNRGTGDISVGARAEFDQNWKAELRLTHYFGRVKNADTPFSPMMRGQNLSNWDSIQLSLQFSF